MASKRPPGQEAVVLQGGLKALLLTLPTGDAALQLQVFSALRAVTLDHSASQVLPPILSLHHDHHVAIRTVDESFMLTNNRLSDSASCLRAGCVSGSWWPGNARLLVAAAWRHRCCQQQSSGGPQTLKDAFYQDMPHCSTMRPEDHFASLLSGVRVCCRLQLSLPHACQVHCPLPAVRRPLRVASRLRRQEAF